MKEAPPLQKIVRAEVYNRLPHFPSFTYNEATDTDTIVFPKVQKTMVLCAEEAATFETRVERFAEAICDLAGASEFKSLLFMGASPTPWRSGKSTFPPAKAGLQFLSKEGVDRQFNGGIYVLPEHLCVWIPHLMWLVRTGTISTEVYFTNGTPQLLGTFCQSGNLHLSLLQETIFPVIENWLRRFHLTEVSASCTDAGGGAIAGRQLRV